jgi:hypothetical protein
MERRIEPEEPSCPPPAKMKEAVKIRIIEYIHFFI